MTFFCRRTLFVLTLILFACAANAAAATFTAVASGPWTTPATWSVSGVDADGIPDSDDNVSIPNTRAVTVTGSQTVQNVSVVTGGTLTMNGGSTLTLMGSYTNTGTTDGLGSVIMQGASSFNIDGTFTAPLFISAAVTASGSTLSGPVTIMTGGTVNSTNQTVTFNGDLTVEVGGTLTKSSGNVNAAGANIVNNGTINGGGFIFFGAAQNLSGTGTNTANFTVIAGTTVTLASSVTVGNGAVSANLTINTGGSVDTGSNVLTLNGAGLSSSAGAISGVGGIRAQSAAINLGSLVTAPVEINSGTTTATGNTMNGSLTISNGATLNISNQTVGVNGDVTVNAGGTLTDGVAAGTFNFGGQNFVNNGTIELNNVQFTRTGTQNLSGSGSLIDSVTVFNGSVTTLTSDVTIGNGVVGSTLAVNAGGTMAIGGFTLTVNGVAVSGGGSYTSSGSGKIRTQGASSISVGAGFTGSLEINSGTTTSGGGTIGGSLTVMSGATFNSTNQSVTVNGVLTVETGGTMTKTSGTITFNGPSAVIDGTVTGGGFIFNGTGTQNFSGTGSIVAGIAVNNGSVTTLVSDATIGDGVSGASLTLNGGGTLSVGNFTLTLDRVSLSGAGASNSTGAGKVRMLAASSLSVGGTFTAALEIASGTTNMSSGTLGGPLAILDGGTMNITNQTVSLLGDVNISAGGSLASSTLNGTLNASGANFTNNGTITGLAFRFNGAAQTVVGTGNFAVPVTIFSGSIVTLASDHQFSSISVNAGGTFATGAFTAFLNGGGTPLSGAGTIANVNVWYNGTAAQTVQATNVTYNQLGIDNPANVTLSAAESVASRLILANGTFNNGANLTLADNATIARANGSLAASPTFSGVINIEYYGSNPIATGFEVPPSNTIGDVTNNNTSTVTLTNSLTVNGNALLASGSTLTGGGGTALIFNGSTFVNNGAVSVPTTTFSGTTQSLAGTGTWTGAVFQLSGSSNTSLGGSVTFGNGTFTVPGGTTMATGGNLLTFNGTTFTNAGSVSGSVRTTGANVGLTAGASGFNASLNVNAGTTTAAGVINGPLTIDASATGMVVSATVTVTGSVIANAPLTGAGTFRVNGPVMTNNALVSVAAFQFGGAAQSLGGAGSFTGAATVLSGSSTTLGVDKQMGSVTVNAGGTLDISNRTLLLSGAGTPLTNLGALALAGSTVEYNGSAAQTLSTGITTYNNLSLNNTAGVSGFAGLTVTNLLRVRAGTFTSSSTYKDVQIDAGATLAGINATTINVSGTWTNDGTFTANGNTVNFNGPSGQSVGGSSATTFNNVIAAATGTGLTLGQNATVNGVLTLTNDITTGVSVITMPSGATSTGTADVIGNVRRTGFINGGAALSFGNPFNSIAFGAGGTVPADVTVNLVKAIPVGFPAAIQRTYTITPSGGAGFDATVRLHYLDAELNGNTEANLKLWRLGSFWALQGSTAINTTNNWVEQSGITQFSPWTLSSGEPPKVTGRVTYENTSNPNVPVSGTTMTAAGTPNSVAMTDANGNYSLTSLGLGAYTVTPSRPNMNSAASNGIFANDAALISRHVVGLVMLNPAQIKAASVAGQPFISSFDAGLIAQWIVGIPNAINQTGRWKFTPVDRSYASILSDQTDQNHTAILMGDVSGDWNPALPRADSAGRSDKDPVVASAGKVKGSPGDIVTVPVRIDDLKGTEVSSFQFDVEYDPDVVAPTDNSASVVGTKTEGMVVASNVVEPGLLKVVVFGPYPVRGDGVYVDLRFNTANTAGTSSPLAIKEFRFNDGTDAVSTVDGQIDLGAAADGPVLAGRVVTPDGKAVVGAEVTVTSTAGAVATVKTDHEGRFEYEGVIVGETYTVAAGSKRLQFDPVWVSIVDRVTEIDIIAQPAEPPSAATADQF